MLHIAALFRARPTMTTCKGVVVAIAMWSVVLFTGCLQQSATTPPANNAGVGESAASPAGTPSGYELRPAPESYPKFALSNLRFPRGNSFEVDWKLVSGEAFGGITLVLQQPGDDYPMDLPVQIWPGETAGTFGGTVQNLLGGEPQTSLTSGCEVYVVSIEDGFRYKLSDSLTSGNSNASEPTTSPTSDVPVPDSSESMANISREQFEALDRKVGYSPVPTHIEIPVGTRLKVSSNRKFVEAVVIEALADGQLRIRYEGADAIALLPRSALRIEEEVLAALPQVPFTAVHPGEAKAQEENLVEVPSNIDIPPGTPLRTWYRNEWARLTSIDVDEDGKIKVHWDGYDSGFDESKPRSELRIDAGTLAKIKSGQPTTTPPSSSPAAPANSTQPTKYAVGQKLEAKWANQWLPVTVKKLLPDGRVEIHWDGYSDTFDEAVAIDRLRPAKE